jgi:hypothetical protein
MLRWPQLLCGRPCLGHGCCLSTSSGQPGCEQTFQAIGYPSVAFMARGRAADKPGGTAIRCPRDSWRCPGAGTEHWRFDASQSSHRRGFAALRLPCDLGDRGVLPCVGCGGVDLGLRMCSSFSARQVHLPVRPVRPVGLGFVGLAPWLLLLRLWLRCGGRGHRGSPGLR